jgi:hypothetical protein
MKYVLIEMIEDDVAKMTSDSIISGVFKGVRYYNPPKEDVLILVENAKDETVYLLNTKKYNILSMQKFDGFTKILHCFRAVKEDQELAMKEIVSVIEDLRKADRTLDTDDNIIDTSTFSNIPKDTTIITNINSNKSSTHTRIAPRHEGTTTHYCNNNKRTTTYVNKGPEPRFFKRKKKPTQAMLDKMEKKISEIKTGTYKPKLPKVAGDDEEVAYGASSDDDNTFGRQYYMHGAG